MTFDGIPDLRDILDALQEGFQIIGPDFTYRYVNPVASQHGKRGADEMIGRRMTEMYPGIEGTQMFAHLARIMREGGLHRMENLFTFPDGSSRWFELCMTRVSVGVVILSLDITERKRAAVGTRRIQRMEAVGQLAGGVAHDFNNLLTVIQTSASFLRDEVPKGGTAQSDIETILGAVATASQLTHKLLAFARQMPVAARSISVAEAISSAVILLRRVLGSTVTLTTEVEDDVGFVVVDPSSLDQILINLAVNARDAMPQGGKLAITARQLEIEDGWLLERGATIEPGSYAEISVHDSGTGIPPDVLEHIFEPFFTTKSEDRGTGLGLPTCWGLVAQAGGTMTVYSEVGKGTTFRIYLPAHRQPSSEAAVSHSLAPVSGPLISVLVVEDQPELHALIARVLRPQGYRLLEATSAEEALEILAQRSGEVDVLLSDVVMPGTSGLELAAYVRANHPRIRILLMSGFGGANRWQGQPSLSSTELLAKPFTPQHLIDAIRRTLAMGTEDLVRSAEG